MPKDIQIAILGKKKVNAQRAFPMISSFSPSAFVGFSNFNSGRSSIASNNPGRNYSNNFLDDADPYAANKIGLFDSSPLSCKSDFLDDKFSPDNADVIYLAIPPHLGGNCQSYDKIAESIYTRITEFSTSIEVQFWGLEDKKSLEKNQSVEFIADQYLEEVVESFCKNPHENSQLPKRQIILLAYSSAFPIALGMTEKFNALHRNENMKIVALDPTPKDYFNKNTDELASLLLQTVFSSLTALRVNPKNNNRIRRAKVSWTEDEHALITYDLSTILPLITQNIPISLGESSLKSELSSIINSILTICSNYYDSDELEDDCIRQNLISIIINFLSLYQWFIFKGNSSEVSNVCENDVIRSINAGFSIYPKEGKKEKDLESDDQEKLAWNSIKEVTVINQIGHERFLLNTETQRKIAMYLCKISLQVRQSQLEAILMLNSQSDSNAINAKLNAIHSILEDIKNSEKEIILSEEEFMSIVLAPLHEPKHSTLSSIPMMTTRGWGAGFSNSRTITSSSSVTNVENDDNKNNPSCLFRKT